jgi:predicted small lipoprotein YifL
VKIVVPLLLFFLLAGWTGCGKKGPPAASEAVAPERVTDLQGDVVEREIRLSWTVPAGEGLFKLYKATEPFGQEPCVDCPVRFTQEIDIDTADPKAIDVAGDKVSYRDSAEAGYRSLYKIVVISADGLRSKDSNIVCVP